VERVAGEIEVAADGEIVDVEVGESLVGRCRGRREIQVGEMQRKARARADRLRSSAMEDMRHWEKW